MVHQSSPSRITTTLDPRVQEGSRYALRHHLTRLGVLLEQPKLEDFFSAPAQLKPVDSDQVRAGRFHRGVLVAVDNMVLVEAWSMDTSLARKLRWSPVPKIDSQLV